MVVKLGTLPTITNAEKLFLSHERVIIKLEISDFHRGFQELCNSLLCEQKALIKLSI